MQAYNYKKRFDSYGLEGEGIVTMTPKGPTSQRFDQEVRIKNVLFHADALFSWLEHSIDKMGGMIVDNDTTEENVRWAQGARSAFYQTWVHLIEYERKFLNGAKAFEQAKELQEKRGDPYFRQLRETMPTETISQRI